ncbi:MAG: heavy metal translocating P-type ATPase [Eubacteriales bacterium]|nr:heavy metal translocating P-type ATPase [Eubacteriales bacterium]
MIQFNIIGMSCASCSSRIEKAVSKLPNITLCSVNLLTNTMAVDGTCSIEDIIKAVEKAGYKAILKNDNKTSYNNNNSNEDELKDLETPILKKRFFISLIFLIALMYFSMGHTMLQLPLPDFFNENFLAISLVQFILASIIMIINQKFFTSGFNGLIHKAPNMDTLVALGSSASFIYSSYSLFLMTYYEKIGNVSGVMHIFHDLYFESAAMILVLITLGKMLESKSKGKTTNAIKSLMKLSPKKAIIEKEGKEIIIPIDDVKLDDIFILKPGENVPVDGIVVEGESVINEAALTGESIPVEKEVGDNVSCGTTNQYGFVKCKATRVGKDTTISQIIRMVSESNMVKAPVAKIADKVSSIFVPTVIVISIITTIVWIICGKEFGFALARGISVLVMSCPCALGLATPVAIMVGNGIGAKNGILFKNSIALEQTGKTEIVVLDKTGTITKGEPGITNIIPAKDFIEEDLLTLAYSLEVKSEHPLAKAIVKKAKENNIIKKEVESFVIESGNGLSATMEKEKIYGGNKKYISTKINIEDEYLNKANNLSMEGKTPLFFAKENKLCGIIAIADEIKEDSIDAIKQLKKLVKRVIMLTGDNEQTAKVIGERVGIDEVVAGVLPNGKQNVISELKKQGNVTMVGDGINDAPALSLANIGIAIGAGSDIAIDSSQVVLINNKLSDVPSAIRLSKLTLRNIHQNLFWAFFYNVIGIPLAAGVFIPLFNIKLNPMFGAAAMSMSSVCVISNALRLNYINIHDSKKDKKIKKREKIKMKKIITIEGMMCAHCEARVKKALEDLPQVESATVSHEDGKAQVLLNNEVENDILKKAIEDQDYKVINIE